MILTEIRRRRWPESRNVRVTLLEEQWRQERALDTNLICVKLEIQMEMQFNWSSLGIHTNKKDELERKWSGFVIRMRNVCYKQEERTFTNHEWIKLQVKDTFIQESWITDFGAKICYLKVCCDTWQLMIWARVINIEIPFVKYNCLSYKRKFFQWL